MDKSGITEPDAAENGEIFRRIMEETVSGRGSRNRAVGVKSLDLTADIIAGSPAYGRYLPRLYGFGNTTKILNQMDRGVIKGLVVTNQFDAGYLKHCEGSGGDRKAR